MVDFTQTPLLRFLPLQRLRIEATGGLHACALALRDLPQSRRSALAVFHDLDGFIRSDPSRGLPRIPLLGFLPSRHSRFAGDSAISGFASPHDLPRSCSRLHGDELPRLASAPGLQGLTPATRPYPPTSGFPSAGDRRPLGFYFLRPRFPERSRTEVRSLPGPYGPVTCSELKKSNNVLRKKLRLTQRPCNTLFRRKRWRHAFPSTIRHLPSFLLSLTIEMSGFESVVSTLLQQAPRSQRQLQVRRTCPARLIAKKNRAID